jgi:hypothetical protein
MLVATCGRRRSRGDVGLLLGYTATRAGWKLRQAKRKKRMGWKREIVFAILKKGPSN